MSESCKNCGILEKRLAAVTERVDVLGTDNEQLKLELKNRADILEQLRLDLDKLTGEFAESLENCALKSREIAFLESKAAEFDRQISEFDRIQDRNRRDADRKLSEAKSTLEMAQMIRVRDEAEIWDLVAERLGLPLRTGYQRNESEVVFSLNLERQRAQNLRAAYETLRDEHSVAVRRLALPAAGSTDKTP
jgi:chromosome segregation ATPase